MLSEESKAKIKDFYLVFSMNFPAHKIEESCSYFLPELEGDVPWTLIFSSLGNVVGEEIKSGSFRKRKEIFALIASAMKCGDEGLSTVVATGLLEELYKLAGKDEALMNELLVQLDGESVSYLKGWLEWSGGKWGRTCP
ncbi:DUF7674 family protein [Xanthomonas sacchari]